MTKDKASLKEALASDLRLILKARGLYLPREKRRRFAGILVEISTTTDNRELCEPAARGKTA